eukprot:gene20114-26840_t
MHDGGNRALTAANMKEYVHLYTMQAKPRYARPGTALFPELG